METGNLNGQVCFRETGAKVGQHRFWVEGGVDHQVGSTDPATGTPTRAMGVILGRTDLRIRNSGSDTPD
jgi:hypothetical protein